MFKIGDFSKLSMVSVKALRYYAERDLVPYDVWGGHGAMRRAGMYTTCGQAQ